MTPSPADAPDTQRDATPPPLGPLSARAARGLPWIALAALLALGAHSVVTARARMSRPHPLHTASADVPALNESPWPTLTRVDPNALPWVLDPVEAWPEEVAAQATRPCGLLDVLAARYPRWAPAKPSAPAHTLCAGDAGANSARTDALTRAGWLDPGPLVLAGAAPQTPAPPAGDGMCRRLRGEDVILEQRGQYELALTRARGLVVRRRP